MNVPTNTSDTIPCPECDTPLPKPEHLLVGLVVECNACGTESEFISLTPPALAPLEEEK